MKKLTKFEDESLYYQQLLLCLQNQYLHKKKRQLRDPVPYQSQFGGSYNFWILGHNPGVKSCVCYVYRVCLFGVYMFSEIRFKFLRVGLCITFKLCFSRILDVISEIL